MVKGVGLHHLPGIRFVHADNERSVVATERMFPKRQGHVLHHQNLAGKREADARARGFGREEGNEHFARHVVGDAVAVVAHIQSVSPFHFHSVGFGLDGILGEIDEHLAEQSLVGLNDDVSRNGNMPLELGIECGDALAEGHELHVAPYRFLQLCELAITVDKGCQVGTRFVDGTDAFFEGRALDVSILQVGLADGEDGSHGVHDFVSQDPSKTLPCLHLIVCHELLDFLSHVVERFLQCLFAKQQAAGGQAERKVSMAYGIAHDLRPFPKHTLVVVHAVGNARNQEGRKNDEV